MDLTEKDTARFWSKVALSNEDGCMLWTAATFSNGYGAFKLGGRMELAHRVAWVLAGNEMPERPLVLDHFVCSNRLCVRADHLRVVSNKANSRRQGVRTNNISGVKGVHWHKDLQRWRAEIRVDGRKIYLGFFDDLEDAGAAYDRAAVQHFGTAALTNAQLGRTA